MTPESTNKINLSTITVSVEDLFNKICEMKEAGEKVVTLQISEPMPDIELGKHITFEALGSAYGGATDYDYIAESTPEEKEAALWGYLECEKVKDTIYLHLDIIDELFKKLKEANYKRVGIGIVNDELQILPVESAYNFLEDMKNKNCFTKEAYAFVKIEDIIKVLKKLHCKKYLSLKAVKLKINKDSISIRLVNKDARELGREVSSFFGAHGFRKWNYSSSAQQPNHYVPKLYALRGKTEEDVKKLGIKQNISNYPQEIRVYDLTDEQIMKILNRWCADTWYEDSICISDTLLNDDSEDDLYEDFLEVTLWNDDFEDDL